MDASIIKLIKTYSSYWESDFPKKRASERLLEYLFDQKKSNLRFLSLYKIKDIMGGGVQDEDAFIIALVIAKNSKLIELSYQLIDDDDEIYEVELGSIKDAEKEGVFFHPETGDAVENYKCKLFSYFKATSKLIHLKDDKFREGSS